MDLFDYEKEHLDFLRKHLAECTVLLKSDGSFPLEKPCNIAAYGNGVRNTVKGGTGSGEVNSRYFVNIEQGLADAGFTVTSRQWLDAYEEVYKNARTEFLKKLKKEAKAAHVSAIYYGMGKIMPEPEYTIALDAQGDAAIYVVSRISGEGGDRQPTAGDILLTETEKRDILELNKRYEKFMLVLNTGGPVDLSEVSDVGNILLLSQLGTDTGAALADILLGKANPSGKLSTTWSAWKDYQKIGEFGDRNDTRYKEGIYVGYRYFDSIGEKALFPFGFGMSYTEFSVNTKVILLNGSNVKVRAEVKNTGTRPGKETVQVYVSCPSVKLDRPYQELTGFAKTAELAPGDEELLSIDFDLCDAAAYDEERAAYVLEKGKYIIRVGNSSVHTEAAAVIELDDDAVVREVRNCLGTTDFKDWKPEERVKEDLPDNVPVLSLHSEDIAAEHVTYDAEEKIEDAVEKLTEDELIYCSIGAFDPKGGMLSVIGNASKNVAGAAGETTEMLKKHGFPVLVMADGPAGLRLSQKFYRDDKGAHVIGHGLLPETLMEFMPKPLQLLMKIAGGKSKAPKGAKEEYQYCTALPIGTALAQSWNVDFAGKCGDIVGDEMERFGVHLWLAPAMNIHRSICCGRNFEYFSEDPVLSGEIAAAVTAGVQSHPGRAVTIKHFIANNQETNRTGSNSMISERAAREIYLKGYAICIKKSSPAAVMSSYNLINGTHTNEQRGLCHDILRDEFGFSGILMTDWMVGSGLMNSKENKYAPNIPHKVAAAGGNLYMPGCKKDFDEMKEALADGSLTKKQLQINASCTYRAMQRLVP